LGIKLSDPQNLGIGKMRTGVIFTPKSIVCLGAMLRSIKLILSFCPPREVFKKAMCTNTIKVAAILPGRGRTNKSQQDKSMNFHIKNLTIPAQAYNWIAIMVQFGFQDSLRSYGYDTAEFPIRPHSTLVRNLVTGKIRDWFKNLWGCGRILVSHGVALLVRVASGLEPYSCHNRDAACFFITYPPTMVKQNG
jgi:hypothetical protein